MLNWDLYAAFILIVLAVLVVPGPTMALILLNTARQGGRAGVWTCLGIAAGETALVAGAIGLLSTLFSMLSDYSVWLRWLGTLYILYLAGRAWRSAAGPLNEAAPSLSRPMSSCLQGLVVALSNPKTILFYAALFPGFVDPRLPTMAQLIVLGASFVTLALLFDLACVLVATLVSTRNRPLTKARSARRLSALCLVGVAFLVSPLSALLDI